MGGSLKEIARLTGVAASSVSRALAGKPGVSEEKRSEICAIAERLGYRPNPEARALRTGRAADLLIVMQDRPTEITSYRNHALITLGGAAFDRVRVVTPSASEPLVRLLDRAATEGVAAVIVSAVDEEVPPELRRTLTERGVAVVCLDTSQTDEVPWTDLIEIDREIGAHDATHLLLEGGSEGVYVFLKREGRRATDARTRGIARACREAGAVFDEEMVVPVVGDDFAEGYAVTAALLDRAQVRGLFCYNDKLAVGALKALTDASYRVPEEVMVIGFDDLSFAAYLTTPLTTVAQPVVPCAQAAIDLALRRREEPSRQPERRVFETALIVRETAFGKNDGRDSPKPADGKTAPGRRRREPSRENTRYVEE